MKVMGKLEKKYGKEMPFSVPAGYFEGLVDMAMEQVNSSVAVVTAQKIKGSRRGLLKRYMTKALPYISMAAVVTFVGIMMQLFLIGPMNDSKSAVSITDTDAELFQFSGDVTDEEIIEYLSNSVYDVETFLASMQ